MADSLLIDGGDHLLIDGGFRLLLAPPVGSGPEEDPTPVQRDYFLDARRTYRRT